MGISFRSVVADLVRHPHRLLGGVTVAAHAPVLGIVLGPPSSGYAASGSCQSPHCYSELVGNGSFAGAESQFHNESLPMPNSEVRVGRHLTNELWLVAQHSSSVVDWVEEGVAIGCSVFPGSGQTWSQAGGRRSIQSFGLMTTGLLTAFMDDSTSTARARSAPTAPIMGVKSGAPTMATTPPTTFTTTISRSAHKHDSTRLPRDPGPKRHGTLCTIWDQSQRVLRNVQQLR